MFNHDSYQVATLYYSPYAGKGRYFVFKFPNGYTALVSMNDHTFDGYRWHYELQFQNDNDGKIYLHSNSYGNVIKNVFRWLDEEDVESALREISLLPRAS